MSLPLSFCNYMWFKVCYAGGREFAPAADRRSHSKFRVWQNLLKPFNFYPTQHSPRLNKIN